MKKITCMIILLFFAFNGFTQNVPEDIILSYQNELETWISQNNVTIEPRTLDYEGLELFREPYKNQMYPGDKVFGMGGSVIDCFALGKFLSKSEAEKLYPLLYEGCHSKTG